VLTFDPGHNIVTAARLSPLWQGYVGTLFVKREREREREGERERDGTVFVFIFCIRDYFLG
jgi:hypothetical protein